MPPKIWRPKTLTRYISLDYGTDIDDGKFDYSHYGNTVLRPKLKWVDRGRDDLIIFDEKEDMDELVKTYELVLRCQQDIHLSLQN